MRVTDRPHVSPWMLWTAEHQARLARQIEDANLPKARAVWIEHRAYVLSALVTAAGFVESFINELFQDVDDRARGLMHPADWLDQVTSRLPSETQQRMCDHWTVSRGRRPTLDKYERFIECCGGQLASEAREDLRLVSRLRNEILHYRPADHYSAPHAHQFETELKKRKIAPNPLAEGPARSYWTEQALSAGLAEWCFATALRLADEVSSAAGIKASYALYRRGGWFDARPGDRAVSRLGGRAE